MASNQRYLAALSAVDPAPAAAQELHRLGEPCRHGGRGYGGFNPACRRDLKLMRCLCEGEHLLKGFCNADVRQGLFGQDPKETRERRRRSAATGRLLKRLHVRGLVLKVPHRRRWHVSARGRELFTGLLRAHHQLIAYPAKAA